MNMTMICRLTSIAALLTAFGGCATTQGHQTGAPQAACLTEPSQTSNAPTFEADREAILAMSGEYSVTFQFKETVALREGYALTDPYVSAATEVIEVIEDSGTRIDMQHILLVGSRIVKHWRQTWTYEPTMMYEFRGNLTWEPRAISASEGQGKWLQVVTQVDDSPRYSGFGAWEHRHNLSSWESKAWRPLPRREYTKRSDYHVLIATNRHTITPTGWVHEQDNYKLVLGDEANPIIAREVGLNVYEKRADIDFSTVRTYWAETKEFWAHVRNSWTGIMDGERTVRLAKKWEKKPLYRHMFGLAEQWRSEPDSKDALLKRLKVVLDGFHADNAAVAAPENDAKTY